MGFNLIDTADKEHHIFCSIWDWHPVVELIATFGVIDDQRIESMHDHAATKVTEEEARTIGEKLQHKLIDMKPGEWLYLDLSISDTPRSGDWRRVDNEKSYAISYVLFQKVVNFCLESKGFRVS